ncbi:intracellular coagulation inhibitor 2-like [Ixodes scapularis]|uniref:intracellular coagulation inhibitor 2-like n=1 Tax=Ixodes scapularis TaxID=6945 RepID=UPI001A9E8046|nr:intracellular coagulation inhibitor 2-like [Ixodes scapularis]
MKLARAQNLFSLQLLKELSSEKPESNIFFSPTSISVALAMVYAGARGKSETEISTALGHTAAGLSSRESILESYKKILAEQQTDDNGLWNASFDPNDTCILSFHNKGFEVVMVETMTRLAKVPFTSEPEFEAIELSYKGDQHCMVIILPSEKKELPKLRDAMTIESIKQIQKSLKDETVKIQLPKFDLKTEYGLVPAVKKMGVRSVFSDADLSRVTGDGVLRVTEVHHKAAIEVNEEGTVAAGATVVVIEKRAPHSFALDRPFLFYIREKATGRMLFLGEVHALPAAKPTLG